MGYLVSLEEGEGLWLGLGPQHHTAFQKQQAGAGPWSPSVLLQTVFSGAAGLEQLAPQVPWIGKKTVWVGGPHYSVLGWGKEQLWYLAITPFLSLLPGSLWAEILHPVCHTQTPKAKPRQAKGKTNNYFNQCREGIHQNSIPFLIKCVKRTKSNDLIMIKAISKHSTIDMVRGGGRRWTLMPLHSAER